MPIVCCGAAANVETKQVKTVSTPEEDHVIFDRAIPAIPNYDLAGTSQLYVSPNGLVFTASSSGKVVKVLNNNYQLLRSINIDYIGRLKGHGERAYTFDRQMIWQVDEEFKLTQTQFVFLFAGKSFSANGSYAVGDENFGFLGSTPGRSSKILGISDFDAKQLDLFDLTQCSEWTDESWAFAIDSYLDNFIIALRRWDYQELTSYCVVNAKTLEEVKVLTSFSTFPNTFYEDILVDEVTSTIYKVNIDDCELYDLSNNRTLAIKLSDDCSRDKFFGYFWISDRKLYAMNSIDVKAAIFDTATGRRLFALDSRRTLNDRKQLFDGLLVDTFMSLEAFDMDKEYLYTLEWFNIAPLFTREEYSDAADENGGQFAYYIRVYDRHGRKNIRNIYLNKIFKQTIGAEDRAQFALTSTTFAIVGNDIMVNLFNRRNGVTDLKEPLAPELFYINKYSGEVSKRVNLQGLFIHDLIVEDDDVFVLESKYQFDEEEALWQVNTGSKTIIKIKGISYEELETVATDHDISVNSGSSHNDKLAKIEDTFYIYSASQNLLKGEINTTSGVKVDKGSNVEIYGFTEFQDELYYLSQKPFQPLSDKLDVELKSFATLGLSPGQFSSSYFLAKKIDNNHIGFINNALNQIQIYKYADIPDKSKAIIVAGGGPYMGNSLWNATLVNANAAYRTLMSQGYTKERIKYFADENFDLDGNGENDDFAGAATTANLKEAIEQWAADSDSLVIYLVDHGGVNNFRMNANEVTTADELNSWLTAIERELPEGVTLVYDACKSGSFLDELSGYKRRIFTSTQSDENAYFLSQGAVSFSAFFWQHIFNGQDLADSFKKAQQTIGANNLTQTPQADVDGVRLTSDLSVLVNQYIGNGTVYRENGPVIGEVTPEQTIIGTTQAIIAVTDISDVANISKVWAVVWPPNYIPPEETNPVLNLPTINFQKDSSGNYSATWDDFTQPGSYQIAVYARDNTGNTSAPKTTAVHVGGALVKRALVIAAGKSDSSAAQSQTELAYQALQSQGYSAEQIYFIAPQVTHQGIDGSNVLANVQYGLSTWLGNDTADLVVYLAGPGGHSSLEMSDGELTSEKLGLWLDIAQQRVNRTMTVLLDTHQSGNWLAKLAGEQTDQRIVMTSTNGQEAAHWLGGVTASFGEYFWRQIQSGSSVRKAFTFAKRALDIPGSSQSGQMDDNGNGIGNEKVDGRYARTYWLGAGIITAGDDPVIASVSPPSKINGESVVRLYAQGVTSTSDITQVKAVVIYPHKYNEAPDSVEVILDAPDNGRYEGVFNDAAHYSGLYHLIFTATNVDGYTSLPAKSQFIQTAGADIYEVDNTPFKAGEYDINSGIKQWRSLHQDDDKDWLKVYLVEDEVYSVRVDDVGYRLDPQIKLYNSTGELIERKDAYIEGEGETLFFEPATRGLYFVEISHSDKALFNNGHGMEYSLIIDSEQGEFPGDLVGTITYSNGDPVAQVELKTSYGIIGETFPNGGYHLSHVIGNHKLMFTLGDKDYEYPFLIKEAQTTVLDITINGEQSREPIITVPADIGITVNNKDLVPDSQTKIVEFLSGATAVDSDGTDLSVTHNAPTAFPVGNTVVTFTAIDSEGYSVSDSATIWIDFVDIEKPFLTGPQDIVISIEEGEVVTDTHADVVEFLAGVSVTDNVDTQIDISHDAPKIFEIGTTIVRFYAADTAGNVTDSSASVTVTTNDVPRFTSEPDSYFAYEDQLYTYTVTVADKDDVEIVATKLPGWLSFQGDVLSGTPLQRHADDNNTDHNEVVLNASDSQFESTQSFSLFVRLVNDKPVFTSVPVINAEIGVEYNYLVVVTDEEGTEVSVSAEKKPKWLSFSKNVLTGVPDGKDIGSHEVILSATDGKGTTTQSFSLTVGQQFTPVDVSSMMSWLKLLLFNDKPSYKEFN